MSLLRIKDLEAQLQRRDTRIAELEAQLEPIASGGVSRLVASAQCLHQITEPQAQADDVRDAELYKLLRRGQHWSVVNGIGDILRGDELDAAITANAAKGGAA